MFLGPSLPGPNLSFSTTVLLWNALPPSRILASNKDSALAVGATGQRERLDPISTKKYRSARQNS